MQFPVNRTIVDPQGNRRKILESGVNACLIGYIDERRFSNDPYWVTFENLEKCGDILEAESKADCTYAHCKCMNLSGSCVHHHYADCKKSEPKWRPELGERYWFISTRGAETTAYWNKDTMDFFCLSVGNVHKTEEQATQWKQKLIERMGN